MYLTYVDSIQDPEEHWVPGVDSVSPGGGGGSESPTGVGEAGSKRGGGDAAKENASPTKRKRTKTTEIVLPNAPKEGMRERPYRARLNFRSLSVHAVAFNTTA